MPQNHYKIATTEYKNEETNSPVPVQLIPPNSLFPKRPQWGAIFSSAGESNNAAFFRHRPRAQLPPAK
ncbi:MAG: hypothetical protein NT002_09780 [candidate division Zixibacteria bacterium]|nr:hypothetical protein [candidate division Zixibacteria bacterium]